MNNLELYSSIAVMATVNFMTRVFPFVFFAKKELPKSLVFVQKYFPAIIMTILIVYSIKDINLSQAPYGFKEIGSILFIIVLHLSLKNYLISIFLGTIFYMGLVQYL
jgi:branched-subunit amino acid transport protein AzlD